jgi:altronate hydrolase
LRIHANDNVCVAIHPLAAGSEVVCEDLRFTVIEDVRLGAKLALCPLQKNDLVIKFGEPIGSLNQSVGIGGYIHTHNLSSDYSS